jgi:hypothetical protein
MPCQQATHILLQSALTMRISKCKKKKKKKKKKKEATTPFA